MIRMKVKELIEKKGLSMLVVSEKAGISYTAVRRACSNYLSNINFSTLDGLCKALDCTPGDLIEYI